MTTTVLVSIICPDQTGLVAAVTGELFDLGINLGDTTFAILGGGAEFTAVCSLPEETTIDQLKSDLQSLTELEQAEMTITRFDLAATHSETAHITHRISLRGGDRPGLIARLSEVLIQFNANIVRLNSEGIPGGKDNQYEVRIAAWIPEKSAKTCLATIANTAGELRLSCTWNEA
ncbi:MAG TPA: amino acid-binding protein [Rhodospirillales bacterium]|nr:amino acid-binding protein [Rhodospirillales bacterium]